MGTQRQASKREWTSLDTEADINSGSLQRIADATEIMAGNYVRLQNDLELYKKWYSEEVRKTNKLLRSINAYRGIFNKKKKKK